MNWSREPRPQKSLSSRRRTNERINSEEMRKGVQSAVHNRIAFPVVQIVQTVCGVHKKLSSTEIFCVY